LRLFVCQACDNIVYFESRNCNHCGHRLGYLPDQNVMRALAPEGECWRQAGDTARLYTFCANARKDACNWLIPAGSADALCAACRHNGTIPDLSDEVRLKAWREMEDAKHRLIYSLLRWKLPLRTRLEDPEHGLIFHFLADEPERKVMTGHDNGVITIALSEADDIERERRRQQMGEPYRTLLGHFRHEVGHHYWDLLVRDRGQLEACRQVFGDDTQDYEAALRRHYRDGPPANWRESYVSAYATSHPWEDFAETWAHYLHIVDTLEMAGNFGMQIAPVADRIGGLRAAIDFDPYEVDGFEPVAQAWLPFVLAMNSLSRTIGSRDMYPFVLAPPVIGKLTFIHQLVQREQGVLQRSPAVAEAPLGQSI
jgi:hypothetical protein